MDYQKLVTNPVRLRIMQFLRVHGEATGAQVAACLDDVPRATAYRHLKLLEEGGIVEVRATRQVRGAKENTYALVAGPSLESRATPELSTALHLELMHEMGDYLAGGDADCARDRVFFQTALVQATDEEYDRLLADLAALLAPYVEQGPASDRRMRKLTLVSAPPYTAASAMRASGEGGAA